MVSGSVARPTSVTSMTLFDSWKRNGIRIIAAKNSNRLEEADTLSDESTTRSYRLWNVIFFGFPTWPHSGETFALTCNFPLLWNVIFFGFPTWPRSGETFALSIFWCMSSLDPCREGKSGGGENKCLSFTWILKATPPIAKILASFFFRAMGISFEIRMRPDQSLQNVMSTGKGQFFDLYSCCHTTLIRSKQSRLLKFESDCSGAGPPQKRHQFCAIFVVPTYRDLGQWCFRVDLHVISCSDMLSTHNELVHMAQIVSGNDGVLARMSKTRIWRICGGLRKETSSIHAHGKG